MLNTNTRHFDRPFAFDAFQVSLQLTPIVATISNPAFISEFYPNGIAPYGQYPFSSEFYPNNVYWLTPY